MSINKDLRDRLCVLFGISLDFLHFTLYGLFTYLFVDIFFPGLDEATQHTLVYSTSIMDILSRIAGTLGFSYIGEKYGRAISLKLAALFLIIPSFCIPFLPGYEKLGILAPIILLITRFFQGFCCGGDSSGGAVYLYESRIASKYCITSLNGCAASLGILFATAIAYFATLYFSKFEMQHYGWRIGFGIVSVFSVLSFLMRLSINETDFFLDVKTKQSLSKNPLVLSVTKYYKELLLGMALTYFPTTVFVFAFSYSYEYARDFFDARITESYTSIMAILALRIVIVPMVALVADRIGGVKIFYASCICGILAYYFFLAANEHLYLLMLFLGCISVLNTAVLPGILFRFIPQEVRFTMTSIIFCFSFLIFGGVVPYVSNLLIEIYKSIYVPALYISITAVITFFAATAIVLRGSNYFTYFSKQQLMENTEK